MTFGNTALLPKEGFRKTQISILPRDANVIPFAQNRLGLLEVTKCHRLSKMKITGVRLQNNALSLKVTLGYKLSVYKTCKIYLTLYTTAFTKAPPKSPRGHP